MKCKFDYESDGTIPKLLCAFCNPRKTKPPVVCDEIKLVSTPGTAEKYAKRKVRKLRAERREWQSRIDLMQGRVPAKELAKAETALRDVERELFMVA